MRDVKDLITNKVNLLARSCARKLGLILTFLIPSCTRLCEKVYLMGKQFFHVSSHVSSRILSVSCKILFRVNRPLNRLPFCCNGAISHVGCRLKATDAWPRFSSQHDLSTVSGQKLFFELPHSTNSVLVRPKVMDRYPTEELSWSNHNQFKADFKKIEYF
jgi:hypothetical protein